jgi:hypothetical protein
VKETESDFGYAAPKGGWNEICEDGVLDGGNLGIAGNHAVVLHVWLDRAERPAGKITHPGFYYGFVGVALAWQIAFLVIARDPVRLRPMMIPSVVEKFTYGIAVVALVVQGRMHRSDLVFVASDSILGLLFVIAYLKTRSNEARK